MTQQRQLDRNELDLMHTMNQMCDYCKAKRFEPCVENGIALTNQIGLSFHTERIDAGITIKLRELKTIDGDGIWFKVQCPKCKSQPNFSCRNRRANRILWADDDLLVPHQERVYAAYYDVLNTAYSRYIQPVRILVETSVAKARLANKEREIADRMRNAKERQRRRAEVVSLSKYKRMALYDQLRVQEVDLDMATDNSGGITVTSFSSPTYEIEAYDINAGTKPTKKKTTKAELPVHANTKRRRVKFDE